MVVVLIVAILASVAIPSYSRYLDRSHRSDAQRFMTTIANRQTQYLLDARTYTSTIGAGGLNLTALDGWSCEETCNGERYTISVTLEGEAFFVTGTPKGNQTDDGTLLLTSSGERSRTVGDVDKGW